MSDAIVVTGASGFLGGRVVRRLAESGRQVVATARRPGADLESDLGVPVRRLDVLEPDAEVLRGAHAVVHCATPNDVLSRDFDAALRLAATGTHRLLEAALEAGLRRIVFLSTIQVLGTELSGDVTEETPPRCETPYGLVHLAGEEVCRMHARRAPVDVHLVRPVNVHGVPDSSRVDRATLVPTCFVREAVEEGTVTLRSSGRQRRCFVSTDDVARACGQVLDDRPGPPRVVNVASGWHPSIREVAELVVTVGTRVAGRTPELRVLSDEPKRGNDFRVASSRPVTTPSAEDAARAMEQTIERLYERWGTTT